MTKQDEVQRKRELLFNYAVDTRKLEIQLFWQRSIYFWGLVAASLIAFATLQKTDAEEMSVSVVCFGFLTSLAWALQCRGSKYWHEAWEQKVHSLEESIFGQKLFGQPEASLPTTPTWRDAWLRSRRMSVTKIAIAMSDLSVLLWISLGFFVSNVKHGCEVGWEADCSIIFQFLFTVGLGAALTFFGQSKQVTE